MAIVIVDMPAADEVIELTGTNPHDVDLAKRFWQTAYLLPQGESSLVCLRHEVLQRLPTKAPGEVLGNIICYFNKRLDIYVYIRFYF